MKTQAEIVQELNDAKAALDVANTRVAKVGTETDSLILKIADLQKLVDAGGTIGPELEQAAAAVTAGVGTLQTTIGGVDDKVTDT